MTKENLLKKFGQKLFPYFLTGTLALGTLPTHMCHTPVWNLMFPPVAVITANPTQGDVPLEVNFDGSQSRALTLNCYIKEYHWDFDGDGTTDSTTLGAYTNYVYEKSGEYDAGLVVVDNQGQKSNKDLETIVVTEKEIIPLDKIAFWGRRHYKGLEITDWEIYIMNSDGSEQTRLTDTIGDNWGHRWSPDGSKIAFSSRRKENWEIYVMDKDGKNQTNLSKNASGSDEFPSWSPDGSKIAFTSTRDGINQIYVMNADGSEQTNISDSQFNDIKPVWSPDGSKIAFYSYYYGNMELMVMNADGSEQLLLTDTAEDEEDDGPKWSPQGEILFTRGSSPNREIIVRYPNKERNLSYHEADDAFPAWSPDGNRVAFASKRDENWEIYTIKKNGSDLTRLTYTYNENIMPNWSPDGNWIAFMSNMESFPNFEIYVMKADGSNQTRLTYFMGDENEPRWSPDLTKFINIK